ncbi:ketoacyl-ACP synthase III family protein [Micromonospora sp. CPCC 206061]|uniref:ketoacyl-ACP synthase III family protein n=1 Tax=Micromonospora sp. CPCC 206061 TaxID=3122410 RepID=UPI002FF0AFBB
MKVDDIHISGIGIATTDLVGVAEAVANGWYDADERTRSGLESVSVAGDIPAPDLAVEAARVALAQFGEPGEHVDALFHSSVHPQGPDGWSAQHYINRHTVRQSITSVEIRNGCIGFLTSLDLAICYLRSGAARRAALLTCADNFGTPTVDRWRASNLFVLADGGGAVVLSKRPGFARVLAIGSASDPELEVRHRGSEPLFPPGLTVGAKLNFRERTQYVRDLQSAGGMPTLVDFASVLADTVQRTLAEADTAIDDVARVVHDGFNGWAIRDMFLDPIGVEDKRGIWNFTRRVGHAGPLDQIRGLEYLWRQREVDVGDRVLMFSDAPGMEAACAVVEITDRP